MFIDKIVRWYINKPISLYQQKETTTTINTYNYGELQRHYQER